MQPFPTSHIMMMKTEKYEVIHVFLEIKAFSLTEQQWITTEEFHL